MGVKRILAMGDLHCGHRAGLTPPSYQDSGAFKWGISQREAWKWYTDRIRTIQPIDLVICNGDAIAGKNDKSGGTQMITTDRNEQVQMALECLEQTGATKFRLTHGTPYHTGFGEDFEEILCNRLADKGYNANISSELFLDVKGIVINARHKMSSSPNQTLRGTPLLKQGMFNDQWFLRGMQPRADIIIRSHVHWDMYIQADGRHYISLPALCTLGDKYGARQCDGTVSFGFAVIDVAYPYSHVNVTILAEKLSSQPTRAEEIA